MTIYETIKNQLHSLSKGQQKVAAFMLEHPEFVALHSASEIGQRVGVSETTVIRFCYALSYEGYAQVQKELRQSLISLKKSSLGEYLESKQPLFEQPRFYEQTMAKDANLIVETAKTISQSDFEKTTNLLHNAQTIYILGLRASLPAAEWLYFTLSLLRPNVKIIRTEMNDILRVLNDINKESVLIGFSFHRYWRETIEISKLAKSKGATLVAITDSEVSPITRFSDVNLKVAHKEKSTIDAMPAIISFVNTLVAGMTAQSPQYYEEQKLKYEDYEGTYITKQWS